MKKLKIAIFADTFLPNIDGVVTSIVNKSKALADNGHEVHIFAPKYDLENEFEYKNIVVKRYLGIPALFYPSFKFVLPNPFILRYIKKHKIDVVHFEIPMSLALQGILIGKFLGLPVSGTFHTFFGDPEYLKHGGLNNKLGEHIAWKYTHFFYDKCDLITCPTEKTKQELLAHGFRGNIISLSNGLDLKAFDNSKANNIKKKYNLNGSTLLFVGRIAYEKSLDVVLNALKLVILKHPKTKLLIVGGGPQFDELETNVKKMKLDKHVIMTGPVNHDELLKSGIYAASDIFVTASKTETQGITILEAMFAGVPSVGVDAKGIPDVITDKRNGLIVEPDNSKKFAGAVIKLIEDKKLYEKLSKNCIEDIKEQDMKNVIAVWEKEYLKLLKKFANRSKSKKR